MKAYMTLQHGSQKLGTLHLELYEDSVPKTVQNFVTLLQRPEKAGYLHSSFHRIIPGFMAQGGDFTAGDGTGGESAAGGMMDDENFVHQHGKAGCLSMANSGTNTNGSQFFVTFRPTPHLNGKHVVFGHVDLESGAGAGAGAGTALLEALENIPTGKDNRPLMPVTVVDCGITVVNDGVTDQTATATVKLASTVAVDRDEDEIDLDDDDNAEDVPNNDSNNGELKPAPEETPVEIESEEEDESVPLTKAEALKRRLRKLKQKMNQARQLNRQAVQKGHGDGGTSGRGRKILGGAGVRKCRASDGSRRKGRNEPIPSQRLLQLGRSASELSTQLEESATAARRCGRVRIRINRDV
jgi:cyclophilin family peptidyl-prolyl cis-trans isomerase